MLFPFQFEYPSKNRGWVTFFLIVCCIATYIYQYSDQKRYQYSVESVCEQHVEQLGLSRADCSLLITTYHYSQLEPQQFAISDPMRELNFLELSANRVLSFLQELNIEEPISARGAFHPGRELSVTLLTSQVLHADIWHLFFNLLFFYAFSRVTEDILGPLAYTGFLLAAAIGIAITEQTGVYRDVATLPSIGLSGIVFSVMAFVSVIHPHGMVRMFYWFIVVFGYFRLPALLVVVSFVGINYYDLYFETDSNINYLAHIGGAITGGALAMVYLLIKLFIDRIGVK